MTLASSGGDDDDVKRSNYKETSGAVKGLVSGLTAIVNAFGVGIDDGDGDGSGITRRERMEARPLPSTPRDPSTLAADIAREFTEAKYLWTGDINPEMYDLYCTFTDPTLSFAGLETFQKPRKPSAHTQPAGQGQRRGAVLMRARGYVRR